MRDGAGRVAIVQDHLVQHGGAERALLSMHKALPDAAVYTSFYTPESIYPEFRALEITTSPLNRVGPLRRHHRAALPLLAPAFSAMSIDADVVVCGTSGWAQGVRTRGRRLLYFYAISRWLYEREPYVRGRGPVARAGLAVLSGPLRRWDQRTVRSAQRFVTESTVMRDTLRSIYDIEADVVPLPAVLDPDGSMRPVANLDDGFLLCAARLVPYKNVDVVVRAMADLPDEHLVVAGDGPDRAALEAIAGTNVTFLGTCDDDRLRWLYAHCGAVVSAALEPFGLTPVEGARFGKPTVALDAGGFKDTVLPGVTGLRFAQAEPAAVVASVREFRDMQFDAARIVEHADEYSEARYIERIRRIVDEELALS